jgi:hypothetical protein
MKITDNRRQSSKLRISPAKRELTAQEIMKDLAEIGLEASPDTIERFRKTFRGRGQGCSTSTT